MPRVASRLSLIGLSASLVVAALTGCVRRELHIESDPPGALVYLNGEEVGRTPVTRPFTFYGTYDIAVRKEGFETLKKEKLVLAPWWQWVPFDLFAELFPLTDKQKVKFTLTPASTQPADPQRMFERAAELKARLPATREAATQAATTQEADQEAATQPSQE